MDETKCKNVRTACMDCKVRHIGCHIDCEKYKEFRKIKDKESKARMLNNIIDNFPKNR